MFLITAATEKEIEPIVPLVRSSDELDLLITGVGPVAAAAAVAEHLALQVTAITGVVNVGVGGAYFNSGLELLDICLATREYFGDFGICFDDEIQDFPAELTLLHQAQLFDDALSARLSSILEEESVPFSKTSFVTVSCCTGTKKRGEYLQAKFGAGCENMEGAAVAMVCSSFKIPCIELRCISNMVDERDTSKWKFDGAVEKICKTAETALQKL